MSDPGNVNGAQIDDPVPNSAVVGVDMLSGDGNDPGNPPAGTTTTTSTSGSESFDPGAHTVDAVEAYVSDHPDELDAVLAAEEAGKNRTTLVAWLEDFEA